MTFGGYEFQLFVTFLVILACAFVALLMDYLKGSHEQLRERHVDLLVRQEKYAGQASVDITTLTTTIRSAIAEQTSALAEHNHVMREMIATKRQGGLIEPKRPEPKAPPVHMRDIPVEAIPEPKRSAAAEPVAEAERVKISFVPEAPNVIPFQVPELSPATREVTLEQTVFEDPEPAPVLEEAIEPENSVVEQTLAEDEPSEVGLAAEPVAIESMLEAMMAATEASIAPELPIESSAPALLPAGVQPPEVLASLVGAGYRLTGQAACIGINDYEDMKQKSSKAGAENHLAAVDQLLRGLLRHDNMLVRSHEDEYLLIEPEMVGPFAQRRLNEISEKLWDFQLRNLGSFNVVFSWGAQEAHNEALGKVIEGARERMLETRTNRRNSSAEKALRRLATA
jgi:hypothetical protein